MLDNVVLSKDIKFQSDIWLQFLRKDKFRGDSIWVKAGNLMFDPFFNYRFARKYSPSFCIDHLIVGSNPIINILLALNILKKNVAPNTSIGFFLPKEQDYWFYGLMFQEDFYKNLSSKLGKNISKIEELIDLLIDKVKEKKANLIILDSRYRIDYLEHDDFTNASFLFFSNEKNKLPEVSEFIAYQNDIKKILQVRINKRLYENKVLKKLIWKQIAPKKEKKFFAPILIAKKMYLSSLPQGWMTMDYKIEGDKVFYDHHYQDISFGTAKSICSKVELYKEHSLGDIEDILLENKDDF